MPSVCIGDTFKQLRAKSEKALVVFVTAGDPHLSQLPAIIDALQKGGADIIELGIPFSDPIADGPTIQAASQRALDAGATPRGVLESLHECDSKVPIVLMGYYNPVLRYGLSAFADAAHSAGARATIISDLTPEESEEWCEASRDNQLDTIFLAAPTSTEDRLDKVADQSTGFIYAVSRAGVTGASSSVPDSAIQLVHRLKNRTGTPVCVGFGISKPEHVREVCEVADGAVVGSSIVTLIHNLWSEGRGAEFLIEEVRQLKQATLI